SAPSSRRRRHRARGSGVDPRRGRRTGRTAVSRDTAQALSRESAGAAGHPAESLVVSQDGTHLIAYLRLRDGIDPQDHEFAYYFFVDGERVATQWYGSHLIAAHPCNADGKKRVATFVRHRVSGETFVLAAPCRISIDGKERQ